MRSSALYALGFGLATIAAGLATVLDLWLSLLIVFLLLLAVGAALALIAMDRFKNATPPLPEQAIEEARLTKEAFTDAK